MLSAYVDLDLLAPSHGILHQGRREFSYQELSDGLLYQHDGSAEEDDFALFQASDSTSTTNILLPINVKVVIGFSVLFIVCC